MSDSLLGCATCGGAIPSDGAAIGELSSDEFMYIPFVEDLRTAFERMHHVACFAQREGIDELVRVLHIHDVKEREGFWRMVDEIDRLKAASKPAAPPRNRERRLP